MKPPPRTLELESLRATHCPAACASWLQPAAGAAGHWERGVRSTGTRGEREPANPWGACVPRGCAHADSGLPHAAMQPAAAAAVAAARVAR